MKRPASDSTQSVSRKQVICEDAIFVDEVESLSQMIEEFSDLVRNGDVQAVAEALNNSLFKRYLKLKPELQEESWRAAEGCNHPYEMFELLEDVIDLKIRQQYPVNFDGGDEEEDEEDGK